MVLLQYDIKSRSRTCVVRTEKKRESQRDGDRENAYALQSSEISETLLSLVLYDFSPFAIDYNPI